MRRVFWLLLSLVPVLVVGAVLAVPAGARGTGAPASRAAAARAAAASAALAAARHLSFGRPANAPVAGQAQQQAAALEHQESYTWSGYADNHSGSRTYDSVSGSWTQPSITCSTEDELVAFFVGIDGLSGGSAIEQAGTMAWCYEGTAHYYDWWQVSPVKSTQQIHAISPGDKISASVSKSGTTYTLKVTDSTHTADSFTATQACAKATCPDQSAEWIAETPWAQRGYYPLADFKAWDLTSAAVKTASASGKISSFPGDEITMVSTIDGSQVYPLAEPSALSGGNSFKVTWWDSY